jgi:hypothetical protein
MTFWKRLMVWHETPEAATKDESLQPNILQWIDSKATTILQRGFRMLPRFFISKGGKMGRGPDDLHVGDRIYVLHGGYVPYVLRSNKESSGNESFRLVGECCKYDFI